MVRPVARAALFFHHWNYKGQNETPSVFISTEMGLVGPLEQNPESIIKLLTKGFF